MYHRLYTDLPVLKGCGFRFCASILICAQLPPFQYVCIAGDATVKGYTKLINKNGAYTEIANTGTDEKRCKEL